MLPSAVLFDLDGTLADSAGAMVAALEHACRSIGLEVPDETTLRSFIGPPFAESFRARGVDEDGCARALVAYREHYVEGGGMYDVVACAGVPEVLGQLTRRGHRLAVATSKPEPFAAEILDHLGLACHFEGIYGASLDGSRLDKSAVIERACAQLHLAPDNTVMVGDRAHDVLGARANGLSCVGVLWGFGSRDELAGAGAWRIVGAPDELLGGD